jgi:glycosyltransferase involved in cell wall biosynthesis
MPSDSSRHRLLLIGPTPPPFHGVSGATQLFLSDQRVAERFDITHVDTADRRSIENIGRIDLGNISLGLRHWRAVAVAARRDRPDVCYLPISQGIPGFTRDALFIRAAQRAGARVVLHLRGGYFKTFHETAPAPYRAFIRATLRRADAMIVLGESLRHLFDGLMPPEKVVVVSNGLALGDDARGGLAEGWRERAERRAADPASFRIVYLSNIFATKGIFELIEAVREVRRLRPGAHLVVAGEPSQPSDRARLEEALAESRREGSDLAGAIEYRGVVRGADKWRMLGGADCFALPTYYDNEGQPWSILEAMAARLPVISTDHAAIAETLGATAAGVAETPGQVGRKCGAEGACGLLVPKQDSRVLAAALIHLAALPELREQLGAAGERRQRDRYTQDRFLGGVLDTLTAAAERRSISLGPTQDC